MVQAQASPFSPTAVLSHDVLRLPHASTVAGNSVRNIAQQLHVSLVERMLEHERDRAMGIRENFQCIQLGRRQLLVVWYRIIFSL